jgi:hypothetical protein
MEELMRSDDTPAGTIATERLVNAALDPERYPDGTAFIPADAEDLEVMLEGSLAERRPVAIVYADGREVVVTPESLALASFVIVLARSLAGLLRRRRGSRRTHASFPSVEIPPTYRVEIRREKVAA